MLLNHPNKKILKSLEHWGQREGEGTNIEKVLKYYRNKSIRGWLFILIPIIMLIADWREKIYLNIEGLEGEISHKVSIVMFRMLFLFLFLTYILFVGASIDGIYRDGITNRMTPRFEIITGKGFHTYRDIKTIFYGEYKRRGINSQYIQISKHSAHKRPTCNYFYKEIFANDFFERLEETLRERCSQAVWIQEDRL